ncbi:MAG: MgtC/SapB family protein [Dokdonella sp.]|nr:MAG: MgtC/SapB family protein [Dokdonella sp.]
MIPDSEFVARLVLAAILGGVVGIDRERHEWAAGLRTHMLVCLGAALAMIVSAFGFGDILGTPAVVLDPSRIAAQVISGIGFLGAGTIIFLERENIIRGLTTAAGLWVVAAVGLAVGAGMYLAGIAATAIAWVTLALIKPLERRYLAHPRAPRLRVLFDRSAHLSTIEAVIGASGLAIRQTLLRRGADGDDVEWVLAEGAACGDLIRVVDALRVIPGVRSVEQRS